MFKPKLSTFHWTYVHVYNVFAFFYSPQSSTILKALFQVFWWSNKKQKRLRVNTSMFLTQNANNKNLDLSQKEELVPFKILLSWLHSLKLVAEIQQTIITAHKRSLRRLCFYMCLSVQRRRGRAWLLGGMRGWRGACVVPRGHAWLLGGVHRIRWDTVNERAVRILLECILVSMYIYVSFFKVVWVIHNQCNIFSLITYKLFLYFFRSELA